METIPEEEQNLIHLPPPPVGRLIGFVLKSIEPGRAIFEMEADERHHNPMGTLHGGIYCDLADAAMGFAYASTLDEGETFTTIDQQVGAFPSGKMFIKNVRWPRSRSASSRRCGAI